MPYTLGDTKTFLQDHNWQDTGSPGVRKMLKIANDANSALHRTGKYDFDRRFATLVFKAPKSAGTVSVNVDAAAVTGVGTSFAASDAGGFLRFNSEANTYRVLSSASSVAATLASNYLAAANLAAKSYVLSFPRVALPTYFRCLERNVLQDGTWRLAPEKDLSNLKRLRRLEKGSGTPKIYSVEWENPAATTIPAPYLWVYPDPTAYQVIEVPYYTWPAPVDEDADDFGIPDLEAAYEALRHFQLAYLYRENRNWSAYREQLEIAIGAARDALAEFRSVTEDLQRAEFSDEVPVWNRIDAAPGVEDV